MEIIHAGAMLKELRLNLKLSQVEVATELSKILKQEIRQSRISTWESNANFPNSLVLTSLCQVYDIQLVVTQEIEGSESYFPTVNLEVTGKEKINNLPQLF